MTATEQAPAVPAERRFTAGIDDVLILPLAAAAVVLRRLARAVVRFLIRLLDYAFPILLQIMRFPLFTVRILGDGLAALSRGVVGLLPVGSAKRDDWRAAISGRWEWIRQKISYKAFEHAVHHLFEGGMAWVFRTCKRMTPGRALFVLVLAVLWFPISFVIATGMHAILFAKVATWPAWTQLLHPVATIIAKTKLLVLPVYPAAWPQAKNHSFMQAMAEFARYLAGLYLVQKIAHRYRQMEQAADRAAEAMGRTAIRTGLHDLWVRTRSAINEAAESAGTWLRTIGARIAGALSSTPIIGRIIAHYAERYEQANAQPHEPLSDRVGDFFSRWSVKFTAEYYEAKEKAEAEKRGM